MASNPVYFDVNRDLLSAALKKAIKSKSYSLADVEVLEIHGVTETGETFPITSLSVRLGKAAKRTPINSKPAGKLRLASVDGQAR